MYFISMDGTITLSQISLSSDPSGIFKICVAKQDIILLWSEILPPFLEELVLWEEELLAKLITGVSKVCFLSSTFVILSNLLLVLSLLAFHLYNL
jgi:hypothetical protein